mmetsp:Transcript_38091/g.119970  ORF Transcript_38091/g.119970 Transcript_38091/m.119970 type:complete len:243 (+) Transcript_38091:551-1279(+)
MQIEGSGLAFVVYPQAIAKLPVAPLFALLFFTMLLCLGLDSEFSMVETILTAVDDAGVGQNSPRAVKAAAACLAMFSVGLLFVTRGGLHWLELVDGYAANLTLFIVGGVECLAVGWVYGADRFAADTLEMAETKLPKALPWTRRAPTQHRLTAKRPPRPPQGAALELQAGCAGAARPAHRAGFRLHRYVKGPLPAVRRRPRLVPRPRLSASHPPPRHTPALLPAPVRLRGPHVPAREGGSGG